jgi:hypothetical protein
MFKSAIVRAGREMCHGFVRDADAARQTKLTWLLRKRIVPNQAKVRPYLQPRSTAQSR